MTNTQQPLAAKTKYPMVSVLMSVYNCERYIRESVNSILNQTYKDFEFLIINDGSSDKTSEILSSYTDHRILIITNDQNIGLANSLNKGLAIAKGTYIARQDADDISAPDRLNKQLHFMKANLDVAVLGTQIHYINENGKRLHKFASKYPTSYLAAKYCSLFRTPVGHPSVFFRRDIIWGEYKGYNPRYIVSEDTELWCRVVKNHVIQNLPNILVNMRIHPLSVCGNNHNPGRNTHLALWNTRRQEVINEILGENNFHNEWVIRWNLIYSTHPFIGKQATKELIVGIDQIKKLFSEKYPQANKSLEISNLTADFKAQVALYLVRYAPFASLTTFLHVIITNFSISVQYIPRYFFLFLFGQSGKKLYTFFKNKFKKTHR